MNSPDNKKARSSRVNHLTSSKILQVFSGGQLRITLYDQRKRSANRYFCHKKEKGEHYLIDKKFLDFTFSTIH